MMSPGLLYTNYYSTHQLLSNDISDVFKTYTSTGDAHFGNIFLSKSFVTEITFFNKPGKMKVTFQLLASKYLKILKYYFINIILLKKNGFAFFNLIENCETIWYFIK